MSRDTFLWTCPYCGRHATLTQYNVAEDWGVLSDVLDNTEHGNFGYAYHAIGCPNPECRKVTLRFSLMKLTTKSPTALDLLSATIHSWQLLPESEAKPQPEYIPHAIVQTYREACRIRDLSPGASAALSRRCLQGIIRDFWDVKGKKNLWQEIEAIKDKVDSSTWQAIDGIREVGKIGAHMEQDVNLIIDVKPKEAQLLTGLIELLFEDWYVAKHRREERLRGVIALKEDKKQEMENAKDQGTQAQSSGERDASTD